mgnify:CR=1 FL=1
MIRELAITDFSATANDTVWDVRDSKAFAQGHIESAKNQPLDTLTAELLATTDGTVYVLCGGGTKAVALLNEIDPKRDIVHLTGGTRAAKAAGMTIVSDNL